MFTFLRLCKINLIHVPNVVSLLAIPICRKDISAMILKPGNYM
ncbi:hypothetical protein Patl1_18398 [Pistacia atlantica]|uniref:Uncharacterized protein n=1 Tax=Pistacia atlantica TaxID=434234 RepID=A0ACC1C127_9ROSI|nr:hypothetical protein Patl1_18398 [Pistacia atlantica]